MANSNSLNYHKTEYKNFGLIPKKIHLWEVDGFVKLSKNIRDDLKILIQRYGVRKLARALNFDRETIYSIYSNANKKDSHSIKHLIKIANHLNFDLKTLEKEVTHYGTIQTHMYSIIFPISITPLFLRSVSIHGDGSVYYNDEKEIIRVEWYQYGDRIKFMEKLLDILIENNPIKGRIKSICDNVYSISIPAHLIRIICKSLDLELEKFHSIEFFKKVSKLPMEYKIQVFFQFIVDEGHFKGTTMTVSQKKKWSRNGFKILLDSLNFDHSDPVNDKDDITIYNYNFPRILYYLENAKKEFDPIAGLWFKEKEFIEICKKINPLHYPLIRKSKKINEEIFRQLKMKNSTFCYQDIKNFGRTHSQAKKAICCWKKNNLIERIGWNNYKIL